MIRTLLLAAILAATACKKTPDKPEPLPPTGEDQVHYAQAATRLVRDFTDEHGFVVSRSGTDGLGAPEHRGDSLIWSGIALFALDCIYGAESSKGLLDMLASQDGGIYRHPSLPESVSLDGAIGMWRGALKRATVCGDAAWRDALSQQSRYLAVHDGDLNDASGVKLVYPWNILHEFVLHGVGIIDAAPSRDRQAVLETAVVAWASAVAVSGLEDGAPAEAKKAACFRVHLGLQTLQIIEEAGGTVSQKSRDRFCTVTDGLKLPTVDQWCARTGLLEFIENFAYDEWEYRLQRCPDWETPDADGFRTPALDLLVAYADLYGLGQK